jgi:hypothetical protein
MEQGNGADRPDDSGDGGSVQPKAQTMRNLKFWLPHQVLRAALRGSNCPPVDVFSNSCQFDNLHRQLLGYRPHAGLIAMQASIASAESSPQTHGRLIEETFLRHTVQRLHGDAMGVLTMRGWNAVELAMPSIPDGSEQQARIHAQRSVPFLNDGGDTVATLSVLVEWALKAGRPLAFGCHPQVLRLFNGSSPFAPHLVCKTIQGGLLNGKQKHAHAGLGQNCYATILKTQTLLGDAIVDGANWFVAHYSTGDRQYYFDSSRCDMHCLLPEVGVFDLSMSSAAHYMLFFARKSNRSLGMLFAQMVTPQADGSAPRLDLFASDLTLDRLERQMNALLAADGAPKDAVTTDVVLDSYALGDFEDDQNEGDAAQQAAGGGEEDVETPEGHRGAKRARLEDPGGPAPKT